MAAPNPVRCGPGRLQASVDAAGGTADVALVDAIASKKIRVLGFLLSPAAVNPAVSAVFKSKPAGASAAITCTFGLVAGNPVGWKPTEQRAGLFETQAGEGLTLTTGAGAGGVGVHVVYEVVAP